MSPTQIPREPPPSIALVLITLMVMVGACLGGVLLMERAVQWCMRPVA